jgi:uracil-DNA glycosylase family 4
MANMKAELSSINEEIVQCRACPRLVAHREDIAVRKTKRFADQSYWGRPVPSFGDPKAQLLIVGLAPAAHGANRTGRMFTGDRSGDWLFETMHKFGFASQPSSTANDDGLKLTNAYITAVVRCAPPGNKPDRSEKENCRNYLVRELEALNRVRVVIALGKIAFDGFLTARAAFGGEVPKPKPKFGHRANYALSDDLHLLASYHPSQQNTFTGMLTRSMFHDVFRDVGNLVESPKGQG